MKTKFLFGVLMISTYITFAQVTPGGGGGIGDPVDPGNGNPPPIEDPDPCCLGNYCSYPTKPLFWHRQLELDRYNFNFTGDKDYLTKVNVGYNCNAGGPGKLNVYTNKITSNNVWGAPQSVGFSALAENNTQGIFVKGLQSEGRTTSNGVIPMGIYATAKGPYHAYGVYSEITGADRTDGVQTGVEGFVQKDSSWRNIGVEGVAIGKNQLAPGAPPARRFNIGVSGWANDLGYLNFGGNSMQIFYPLSHASIFGGCGNAPNYSTPSNFYAGWFDGDVIDRKSVV